MCFSPEASLTGGVIISSIGVAALKNVRTPSQIVFASIPLFFGIQQLAEGVVWLAVPNPEYGHAQKFGTYLFLLMARVIWPAMIPLSVLLMEEDRKRRKILSILLSMGLVVSVYYSYCLIFLHVVPHIAGSHIEYASDYPESFAVPVFIIYFIASITPLFISSSKRTRLLGVLMFVSCLTAAIFFIQYLTSVWCFFAAMISVVILWILGDSK